MKYLRRASDDLLDKVLPGVPATAIEGARAVGKTETVRRYVRRVPELDNPHTLSALRAGTDALLGIDEAVLIDEWQHYPPVWDRARRAVDHCRSLAVLLTGSAILRLGTISHPDVGHIASLVIRPVPLTEYDVAPGGIDVAKLLECEATIEGYSPPRLPDYAGEICASGLPGLHNIRPVALDLQLDNYLTRIVNRDLPEEGVLVRRPQVLMVQLTTYAAATPTPASYTVILGVITAGETDRPNHVATQTYHDLFARIWVLDPIQSWTTPLTPPVRFKTRPKHQLLDSMPATHLLDVTPVKLLSDVSGSGGILRQFFEVLITLCVRVCATTTGPQASHLRTRSGDREIDLIVENTAGKVVAIEVKLARDPNDANVRHLHQLGDCIGRRPVDKAVATTGKYAYRRDDGAVVIPLGLSS